MPGQGFARHSEYAAPAWLVALCLGKMALKPLGRQPSDRFQCAGLFEQVGGTRHNVKFLLAYKQGKCRLISFDHA